MPITPDSSTNTLRVQIGSVTLHVHADDVVLFANLLRKPPRAGLLWQDAHDHTRGVLLRRSIVGTELLIDEGSREDISWTEAVDVAGELTGALGKLKLAGVNR